MILYHVTGADTPPARIDATRRAVNARLLDESRGAFVLQVTAPDKPVGAISVAGVAGKAGERRAVLGEAGLQLVGALVRRRLARRRRVELVA